MVADGGPAQSTRSTGRWAIDRLAYCCCSQLNRNRHNQRFVRDTRKCSTKNGRLELMHWIFVFILACSLAIQAFLVLGFVMRVWRYRVPLIEDHTCPSVAIVLCLRGSDPFLQRTVEGLLRQDYPNYRAVIVVDHSNDPANAILAQAMKVAHACRVDTIVLDPTNDRCSLKCASLVQAVCFLKDEVSLIALLDADTIPHPTWLRELATALVPNDVGAATGNRWYMPKVLSLASMIRYFWNAAAIVQMYWFNIAWGGTLAFKLEAVHRAGLLERWSTAFCEDTMSFSELRKAGYRVSFVPSLMMINRENCNLDGFYSWVKRQLLAARLYHPSWFAVVGHGVSSAGVLAIGCGWCLYNLMVGTLDQAMILLCSMVLFQLGLSLLIVPMEFAVRRIVRGRGESVQWISMSAALSWSRAIFATQVVYTSALFGCLIMRRVKWRGVQYEIRGPWDIVRSGYEPYSEDRLDSHESI